MAQVLAPVGRHDLVADQCVDRSGIGNPQQRLGKAHEGDAFRRVETVLGEEALHDLGSGRCANRLDQLRRQGGDALAITRRESRRRDQFGHETGFVG